MSPMEADAAYQGCLPSCELHSRSLAVRHTGKVYRLRMRVTQSPDCAQVLHNLGILRMRNAISRLCTSVTQSRDSENAQRNLQIVQILRLRGTFIPAATEKLEKRDRFQQRSKSYFHNTTSFKEKLLNCDVSITTPKASSFHSVGYTSPLQNISCMLLNNSRLHSWHSTSNRSYMLHEALCWCSLLAFVSSS